MDDEKPVPHVVPEHVPLKPAAEMNLSDHEMASRARYEHLCHKLHDIKEHKMSDKVHNHFTAGDGGGMGSLGPMAAIAALGNRNEGGSLAALAPLMAGHGGLGGLGGFGAGLVGGVLGGVLFGGGRRGGIFGGEGCEGGSGGAETRIESDIFGTAVLTNLGDIKAAIPLGAAQTENVILQQTNQITNLSSQAQLANQMGFERAGDRIQAVGTALAVAISNVNQNVLEQSCQTRAAIAEAKTEILQKIDSNTIANLQAELLESRRREDVATRTTDLNALRSNIEINNTATATQAQGQQQFQVQAQFQDLNNKFARLFDIVSIVHQEQRSTNANIIAGNTGAVTTGAQTSTPTNVNARG